MMNPLSEHGEILFAFSSTSSAIQAEQQLLAAGLPVGVMPLPSSIRAGCGICLRLPGAVAGKAQAVLRAQGIYEYALYLRHVQDGVSTYTPLEGDAR